MRHFNGFEEGAITFFRELEQNNNKVWFEKNRDQYEKYTLGPMKALVNDMSPFFHAIDPEIDTTPVINKAISTIFRDTRFLKNKTLMKTYICAKFKRRRKDWKSCPSFYFDFGLQEMVFGMGFFAATPTVMAGVRAAIDANEKKFLKIIRKIEKAGLFQLHGDTYKKVFDKAKSKEVQNWYQRKGFFLVLRKPMEGAFFAPELVEELADSYALLVDLYDFLWQAKNNEI